MPRHHIALLSLFCACASLTMPAAAQTTRPSAADTDAAPTVTVAVTAAAATQDVTVAPTAPNAASAPAPDQEWPRAVAALAKALTAGDAAAVEAMLAARHTIRRFDSSQNVDAAVLANRLARSALVGQHAYLHPPLVMAADVAADFKNAVGVPERAKVRFLVDDETDIKRANATAVQWVVEHLDARAGNPVGVIVLWTPRPAVPGLAPGDTAAPTHDVTFVLCKAEEVAPKDFRLTTLVFGVPLPESTTP